MGEGCNEKLDWEFVRWVLRDGRTRRTKERYRGLMKKYPEKVVVIRNQRELDEWKLRNSV